MSLKISQIAAAIGLAVASSAAMAQQFDVTVTIENLSPTNGTSQTPHWVGFHDGSFDIYNSGSRANTLPIRGSDAVERMAEDGNNAPLAADFNALQPLGVQATIAGPNGVIGPGDVTSMTFRVDASDSRNAYFSYASMILPSNDFFYANANPEAHAIFSNGNFVAEDFIVGNLAIRDAGTEVNDELESSTAFFGQSAPNTGTRENGRITTISSNPSLVRFAPDGRILSEPRFSMADFALDNYPLVKISFTAEEVAQAPQAGEITGAARFQADITQDQEVPAVSVATDASGRATYFSNNRNTILRVAHFYSGLENVTATHLHLGAPGETGPVVVDLLAAAGLDPSDDRGQTRAARGFRARITDDNLVGPFAGQPLIALIQAIADGQVYINVHTEQNPAGEIRGQLELEQ